MLGRPLEVISRDDAGKPGDALTAANELVARENVVLLMGTFFSHVGLAVADFASQKKVLFIAAEPLSDALVWEKGNRYTFRLRPSVSMQAAMLAEEAAKWPAKRWASVAPNYEYGKSAVAAFKEIMAKKRPDHRVGGRAVADAEQDRRRPDRAGAGAGEPGGDLQRHLRRRPRAVRPRGETRGLFKGREVVSLLTGEPEYLDPLKAEAPVGWLVTGYPWYAIDTPEHRAFLEAYQAKFHDYPRLGSVVGYATMQAVAAIIAKAGSTDTEKMVAAAEGIGVETPFGPVTFRAADHQSTMGAFVGRTAVKDGKGIMVDWHYADGASLPAAAGGGEEAAAGRLRHCRWRKLQGCEMMTAREHRRMA